MFGFITPRHVLDHMRRKFDDNSSLVFLIGYHSVGGYKLYDPVRKKVVINKDVIIDELKERDWKYFIKKD